VVRGGNVRRFAAAAGPHCLDGFEALALYSDRSEQRSDLILFQGRRPAPGMCSNMGERPSLLSVDAMFRRLTRQLWTHALVRLSDGTGLHCEGAVEWDRTQGNIPPSFPALTSSAPNLTFEAVNMAKQPQMGRLTASPYQCSA